MTQYKAVIFDLDGTLLNTIEDITDSMNTALISVNVQPYSVEEYKYFVGDGVDNLVKRVLKNQSSDASLFVKVKERYLKEYIENQHEKTRPYPGIIELLRQLNELGVNVAVLSNKPDTDTQTVIAYYFPMIRFTQVVGKRPGYDVKPDPRAVNEIIDQMKLKKEEVLYVGDTFTDMMTAKNANLRSAGVLWGFRKADELIQGKAGDLIKDPKEILQIVKEGTIQCK